jgi:hypothetical protein
VLSDEMAQNDWQTTSRLLQPVFGCLLPIRTPALAIGISFVQSPVIASPWDIKHDEHTMTDPSSSQWLPDVYGRQELVQPMQAMQAATVPYPFEEGSARSSTSEWVSHKIMTDETRDRLRAYANEHPKVTRQQVAGWSSFETRVGHPS